jgi:hypothetical protein
LDVAFVHGSGEANAPDLLVDDDIWVECKMRQLERDGRKWSQIKDELLDTVVSPDLQADNTIHSFTVTFTDSLDQDDIDELSDTLLRMIENDDTTSEHEQYTVTRTSQSISLSEIEQTLQVDPAFQTDPHGRNLQISAYVDENEEITEYVGAEIQFEFDEDWYYPKKIRSRVKEATSKNLSDKEKSAVFVGVPPAYLNTMVDRQTPVEHRAPDAKSNAISQFERLDEEIRYRILNQSQSLNIVCLYSSGILNKIAYCPLIQYWENEECRHPNHDALSDALLEIHRSYTGYLRANEEEDDKT